MSDSFGTLRVGVSGWRYAPWRGVFYPGGLAQRRELAYVASRLGTVEVNGSFYSLLRPTTYARWRDETPRGFVFALKGSRYITHMLRLGAVDAALANFFASGVLGLGEKLGPILWQLPERQAFDRERVARFFARLPRTHAAAARLARSHDARLEGRALTSAMHDGRLRHAMEPRHPSFADAAFARLCTEHDVAITMADTAGKFPMFDVPGAASFVYVRLHGSEELYVSGYRPAELDAWATRIRPWLAAGRDVYVYFDNDVRARAPFDAMALDARFTGAIAPSLPMAAHALTEQARAHWPAWTRAAPAPTVRARARRGTPRSRPRGGTG